MALKEGETTNRMKKKLIEMEKELEETGKEFAVLSGTLEQVKLHDRKLW